MRFLPKFLSSAFGSADLSSDNCYVTTHIREYPDKVERYKAELAKDGFKTYMGVYPYPELELAAVSIAKVGKTATFLLYSDDEVAGILELAAEKGDKDTLVVGYNILEEYRGKFLMPLLWDVAIRYALDHGYQEITAYINDKNTRSLNTAVGWAGLKKIDHYHVLDLNKIREGNWGFKCFELKLK